MPTGRLRGGPVLLRRLGGSTPAAALRAATDDADEVLDAGVVVVHAPGQRDARAWHTTQRTVDEVLPVVPPSDGERDDDETGSGRRHGHRLHDAHGWHR